MPKIIDLAPDETGAFSVDGHETRTRRDPDDPFLREHFGTWENRWKWSPGFAGNGDSTPEWVEHERADILGARRYFLRILGTKVEHFCVSDIEYNSWSPSERRRAIEQRGSVGMHEGWPKDCERCHPKPKTISPTRTITG